MIEYEIQYVMVMPDGARADAVAGSSPSVDELLNEAQDYANESGREARIVRRYTGEVERIISPEA